MKRNHVWVVEYLGADGKWHPHAAYLSAEEIPDEAINSSGHRIRKYFSEQSSGGG